MSYQNLMLLKNISVFMNCETKSSLLIQVSVSFMPEKGLQDWFTIDQTAVSYLASLFCLARKNVIVKCKTSMSDRT